MVGRKIPLKKRNIGWVSDLLRNKFSGSCPDHPHLKEHENRVNVFCIQCSRCICKHCVSSSAPHHLHTWIQICQYIYNDVVRLEDIQKHLDCSEIQTYKVNGQKAIHLNTRPQSNPKTPPKTKADASCEACGRFMQHQPKGFCSIACKFSMFSENSEDESNKLISLSIPEVTGISLNDELNPEGSVDDNESTKLVAESPEEPQASVNTALKPKMQLRKRKRKGIPCRAPFF